MFLNDLESSIPFQIYSDYACLKVSRETLTTIDSVLEQSRSVQSIFSMSTISTTVMTMASAVRFVGWLLNVPATG